MKSPVATPLPDTVIDRVHRIGVAHVDKSIIVRFTTFYNKTMVYKVKKNMKDNVRGKLDLTKNATTLLLNE